MTSEEEAVKKEEKPKVGFMEQEAPGWAVVTAFIVFTIIFLAMIFMALSCKKSLFPVPYCGHSWLYIFVPVAGSVMLVLLVMIMAGVNKEDKKTTDESSKTTVNTATPTTATAVEKDASGSENK